MSELVEQILRCVLVLLLSAGLWGLLGLMFSLLDSRARVTVRVRGWLVFLAGVCQLAACACPRSPWAVWVFTYLTVVFLLGMLYSIFRGLGLTLKEPRPGDAGSLVPAFLAAVTQVLAASFLVEARSAQLMPLVCLWLGLALASLGLRSGSLVQLAGLCPLMLWLRLVNIESLGVFTLLVWSWVNPLILWSLDRGLPFPDPHLLYAYLCLTATACTLRWSLTRLSTAYGL